MRITSNQVVDVLKTLGVGSVCGEHGVSLISFCEPCRVEWTHAAAEHLRDLAEGGDIRDLAAAAADGTVPEGAHIPTTLAEAADEVDAFAAAIKNGDIS
jgi:hypothetical protein